jgi:pteridine reductase
MGNQRVALITGGTKRVGAAIVKRLAEGGFRVRFTVRSSEQDARDLAHGIAAAGGVADFLKVDLEAENAVDRIAAFVQEVGRLDVLVNNASLYLPDADPIEPLFRRLMRVNAEVPSSLMRRLGPLLVRSEGHVVNLIDLMADRPMPAYSAYCQSKAALKNATMAAARTLAPQVTVNGISPGVVDWPDDLPLDEREKYLARVPLRRAGTPGDVAALVHFLVTEGKYITGQNLHLDGGRSII